MEERLGRGHLRSEAGRATLGLSPSRLARACGSRGRTQARLRRYSYTPNHVAQNIIRVYVW